MKVENGCHPVNLNKLLKIKENQIINKTVLIAFKTVLAADITEHG